MTKGYQSVRLDNESSDPSHQSYQLKDEPRSKILPQQVDGSQDYSQAAERSRWFPWLVLAFAVCMFFIIGMIYATAAIHEYDSSRQRFLVIAWLLFLIPSLVVAFFVLTPIPHAVRRFRHRMSTKRPSPWYGNLLNFLNAVCCLVATAIYLWLSAIPLYNTPHWEDELAYEEFLPIPSTAFVFWGQSLGASVYPVNETVAKAQYGAQYQEPCVISNGSTTSVRQLSSCTHAMEWVNLDGVQAYVFNSSKLAVDGSTFNNLYSEVWLTTYINYRSSEIVTPQLLDVGFPFFDPSINLPLAWHCGLIASPTIPAFEAIYASLDLTYTTDEFGLLSYISPTFAHDPACHDAARALIPDVSSSVQNPYRSWDWGFKGAASTPDLSTCDADGARGENAVCYSQIAMSYSSQVVTRATSVPGITPLDIWVNAGGIVGGVQFFFWFFTMFIGY